MPDAIRSYCARTSQPIPKSHGQMLRCIYESLALKCRWVLSCLETMLGQEIETVHIIGGGSQNKLLCQMTADATGKRVVAGPVEATAAGNALLQAIALGFLGSLAEGRKLVANSFPLEEYPPSYFADWNEAFARFKGLIAA
jgi:rhamnulokinase